MEIIVTKRENGTRRVQIFTDPDTKVEQSHKKECNINTIVAKAHKTGLFPHRLDRPTYGDFSGAVDFHEAKNRIRKAELDFFKLPSEIRNRFNNDPAELIVFINDPESLSEAIELGLLPKSTEQEIEPPAPAVEPEPDKREPATPEPAVEK